MNSSFRFFCLIPFTAFAVEASSAKKLAPLVVSAAPSVADQYLHNADTNPNSYQGFAAWFVADVRAHFCATCHWTASVGVDNALNRKYFLFHPFPQRTVVTDVKYTF